MLLGSDVLCKGRAPPGWNYVGVDTEGDTARPHGWLKFKCGTETVEITLQQTPTASTTATVGSLAMVIGGPPLAEGGRYL